MKYWEFLIQKEGDETWLPLETQQVEILEGRYRVVAHTDRANTPLEIRVSQLVTDEMPPRKRVRKRTSQISEAGLVVVMPFMHLKPGQWQLTCSSINAADNFIGEVWRYSVELQVFAETDEDWSSEWPVPADSESVTSTLIEPGSEGENGAIASTREALPLVQAQAQLQAQRQEDFQQPGQDADLPLTSSALPSPDTAYHIFLKQQAFLARPDQPMTITGQVQSLTSVSQDETASQLWLRLQNPETAQVIMEAHRPLSLARLPADFKVKIQLPANVMTRVVLGEVSLRSADTDTGETAAVLSSTAFTITAGIAQLLDDLANQDTGTFEEEVSVFSGAAKEPLAHSLADSAEPAIAVPALDPMKKEVVPAVGVVIPPEIGRDRLGQDGYGIAGRSDSPELPNFPKANSNTGPLIVTDSPQKMPVNDLSVEELPAQSIPAEDMPVEDLPTEDLPTEDLPIETPSAQGRAEQETERDAYALDNLPRSPRDMVAQPAQFMGTSIEDDDLETAQIAALLEDIDSDLTTEVSDLDALEPPGIEGALPPLRPVTQESDPPAAIGKPGRSKPDNRFHRQSRQQVEANSAFKSLKLKDHFWKRLTHLTHEGRQEAEQLSQNMKAAGINPGQGSAIQPPSTSSSAAANKEVVIFDEPTSAPSVSPATNASVNAPISNAQISNAQISNAQSAGAPPASPPTANQSEVTSDTRPTYRPAQRRRFASPGSAPSPRGQRPTRPFSNPPASFTQPQSLTPPPTTQPEDLPEMALPVISVPVGDLIAGGTVTITVRTRPSAYKPFIKLWMIDRQSRTLVGEPQLLTNLKTDALGDLETSTELRVPMGCLDVQIAAIAVDMATQQESNKAIVNRHVVPAGQQSLSNRGLNF
ncbi:MAG: hypothetical protein AAFQ74_14495 [Cyanobacteria bacterium J06623_4]